MILTFWTSRRTDTQRAFGGLTLAALFLLPTVHPWYVAWTIPFVAIAECLAAWVLSATCLLAYATHIAWTTLNRWESPPWMLWLEWLPFAGRSFEQGKSWRRGGRAASSWCPITMKIKSGTFDFHGILAP
ncbi:MAG: hypothetical protein JNJ88_16290 [Planctomycetes bacterium]|nr:hypothetical protein [Planctomycetota bacterium]